MSENSYFFFRIENQSVTDLVHFDAKSQKWDREGDPVSSVPIRKPVTWSPEDFGVSNLKPSKIVMLNDMRHMIRLYYSFGGNLVQPFGLS